MDVKKALWKLEYYCAYQERCKQEVYKKLKDWGIYGETAQQMIQHLEEEDFLNEARFARMYVSGKFRLKKWGRIKIVQELKQKKINTTLIEKALTEIDEQEYEQTLQYLSEKKLVLLKTKEPDTYQRKQKLMRYLLQKGYERNLIWKHLNAIEV